MEVKKKKICGPREAFKLYVKLAFEYCPLVSLFTEFERGQMIFCGEGEGERLIEKGREKNGPSAQEIINVSQCICG